MNGIDGDSQNSDEVKEKESLGLPDYPPPAPPADEEQTTMVVKTENVYDAPKSARPVADDDDTEDEYQVPTSNKPLRDLPFDNVLYMVN